MWLCTSHVTAKGDTLADVDILRALEAGELPEEPLSPPLEVRRSSDVALHWARELGLRPGTTRGPSATALVPVVDAWATTRGLTGPGHRDVGRGMAAAGVSKLHREDAARLRRLVRAAWAPGFSPDDKRQHKPKRGARVKRTRPPPSPRPFHEEVKQLGPRAHPLCDSAGRVWPAPSAAARALGGSRKAVNHAVGYFRALLPVDSRPLAQAAARRATWRGVWWRYLAPAEVAAVPPGTLTGQRLPGLGWGLTCGKCGACASGSP